MSARKHTYINTKILFIAAFLTVISVFLAVCSQCVSAETSDAQAFRVKAKGSLSGIMPETAKTPLQRKLDQSPNQLMTMPVIETFDPEYFFGDSQLEGGNPDLAQLSALAACTTYKPKEKQVESFLKDCGFQNVKKHFSADGLKQSSRDSNDHGVVYLGARPIADSEGNTATLIAVIISGYSSGGYEWISNFNVAGKNPSDEKIEHLLYHEGFHQASVEITGQVNAYLDRLLTGEYAYSEQLWDHKETGNLKFWITGHSRGGALTNLTAIDLSNAYSAENVYAYGFATPNYVRDDITLENSYATARYKNIINFVSEDDFVTAVPPREWGFTRYGQKIAFDSPELRETMISYYSILTEGFSYRGNSPKEMKNLIKEFLSVAGPSIGSYYQKKYPYAVLIIDNEDSGIYGTGGIGINFKNTEDYYFTCADYCQNGFALCLTDYDSKVALENFTNFTTTDTEKLSSKLIYQGKVTERIDHAHEMITYIGWLKVMYMNRTEKADGGSLPEISSGIKREAVINAYIDYLQTNPYSSYLFHSDLFGTFSYEQSSYIMENGPIFGAQLVDCDRDGILELLIQGPAASANNMLGILDYSDNRAVCIFNEWGNTVGCIYDRITGKNLLLVYVGNGMEGDYHFKYSGYTADWEEVVLFEEELHDFSAQPDIRDRDGNSISNEQSWDMYRLLRENAQEIVPYAVYDWSVPAAASDIVDWLTFVNQ